MNISVGLVECCRTVDVELEGEFIDQAGKRYPSGHFRFDSPVSLTPADPGACFFAIDNVTIGVGFHWERQERQVFRGGFRVRKHEGGLAVINDVPLEEYVLSVISSEMSASCPLELLKAHAVISRSWLWHPRTAPEFHGQGNTSVLKDDEILRWYGREAHQQFDVCADDHCQRYQGITKVFSAAAAEAVRATAYEMLVYGNTVCDARFSKCCGGYTEKYSSAWDDREVPYLVSLYDGEGDPPPFNPEEWVVSEPPAWCNTHDVQLLTQILPSFDQETRDFYRWTVEYTEDEVRELVKSRLDVDVGEVLDLQPLARGASGRITRLKIVGKKRSLIVGKELEIRRALSRSHLYSSAFRVFRDGGRFVLRGAGWGHGVGLCQIGAAVMASRGKGYREILSHYYPNTSVSLRNSG
jgi:SpoIID/LytB domain protein